MMEMAHGDQHRRHRREPLHAELLNGVKDMRQVESRQDDRFQSDHCFDIHAQHAEGVTQREDVQSHRLRGRPIAFRDGQGVRPQIAVRQHHALGIASGSGRIEQKGQFVVRTLVQRLDRLRGCHAGLDVLRTLGRPDGNQMADLRQAGGCFASRSKSVGQDNTMTAPELAMM